MLQAEAGLQEWDAVDITDQEEPYEPQRSEDCHPGALCKCLLTLSWAHALPPQGPQAPALACHVKHRHQGCMSDLCTVQQAKATTIEYKAALLPNVSAWL